MLIDDHDAAREFIHANPRRYVATEIFLPLVVGVAPMWSGQYGPCWYARIDSLIDFEDILPDVQMGTLSTAIVECQHHHPTEAEAWACSEQLERRIAETILERRNDQ